MELSSEDSLRLHVLMSQSLQALRIDESKMTVHALSDKGEASMSLNPNCRDEKYLRLVRQTISSQVLGSPGGYPVYLKRWTRMGQARDDSLQRLLLLGEPEAVIAVVHAPGLTDDLARRAWWANPTAENARRMLERECVAKGSMGPELAEFLVEFLPFEEDARNIIDSVRLVLQPGLVNDAAREEIWNKGKRKNVYYVGFLDALPDALPVQVPAHAELERSRTVLQSQLTDNNPVAAQLLRLYEPAGQAFLQTCETVLLKPSNQDVVVALMDSIGNYFTSMRVDEKRRRDITEIIEDANALCASEHGDSAHTNAMMPILNALPEHHQQLVAITGLSMVTHAVVDPVFGVTDAIGSVMRKRLQPVTKPILEWLSLLQGK